MKRHRVVKGSCKAIIRASTISRFTSPHRSTTTNKLVQDAAGWVPCAGATGGGRGGRYPERRLAGTRPGRAQARGTMPKLGHVILGRAPRGQPTILAAGAVTAPAARAETAVTVAFAGMSPLTVASAESVQCSAGPSGLTPRREVTLYSVASFIIIISRPAFP